MYTSPLLPLKTLSLSTIDDLFSEVLEHIYVARFGRCAHTAARDDALARRARPPIHIHALSHPLHATGLRAYGGTPSFSCARIPVAVPLCSAAGAASPACVPVRECPRRCPSEPMSACAPEGRRPRAAALARRRIGRFDREVPHSSTSGDAPPPPYWPGGQTAPSARHSPQACRPAARVQRLMHLHDLAECGGSAQTTDRQLHSALSRLGQSAGSGSSHPVSERKEGDGGCRGRPLSGRRAQTRPRRGWCPLSGPCGDGGGQR